MKVDCVKYTKDKELLRVVTSAAHTAFLTDTLRNLQTANKFRHRNLHSNFSNDIRSPRHFSDVSFLPTSTSSPSRIVSQYMCQNKLHTPESYISISGFLGSLCPFILKSCAVPKSHTRGRFLVTLCNTECNTGE